MLALLPNIIIPDFLPGTHDFLERNPLNLPRQSTPDTLLVCLMLLRNSITDSFCNSLLLSHYISLLSFCICLSKLCESDHNLWIISGQVYHLVLPFRGEGPRHRDLLKGTHLGELGLHLKSLRPLQWSFYYLTLYSHSTTATITEATFLLFT